MEPLLLLVFHCCRCLFRRVLGCTQCRVPLAFVQLALLARYAGLILQHPLPTQGPVQLHF